MKAAILDAISQSRAGYGELRLRRVWSTTVLVVGPPSSIKGRRVLIVDETCDTGHTLRLALNEVQGAMPAEVRTAVSFKTGPFEPDFHSFDTDKFIILPWDREVVQDGQLVTRPDYAGYLQSTR